MLETRVAIPQSEKERKPTRHLTYNPDFDSEKYSALQVMKHNKPEEYEQRRAMLDGETIFNLKTTLGERYNAGLSIRQDRLLDGKIYGAHSDEPLLTIYERGRDYRFENSSSHDRLREQAEIEGFKRIEAVLGNTETPVGTMMVSFSPPGGEESQYKHNFYDIFTLKEEDGTRFIESSRYSSGLSRGEYINHAASLQPGYFDDKEQRDHAYDAYFLSRPLRVEPGENNSITASVLHRRFHKEHKTLDHEVYEELITACTPLFLAYINVMADTPWAIEERNLTLNALLTTGDRLEKQLTRKGFEFTLYERLPAIPVSRAAIAAAGRKVVREVDTGCGYLGGFTVDSGTSMGYMGSNATEINAIAPFSVMDFGESSDKYGKRSFKCPHCSHANKRPYNTLIKYCQNGDCGRDVSC